MSAVPASPPVGFAEPDTGPAVRAAGSAVEVRGVSRRFGERVALDAVDLTVAPGEVHALLGPNGAGKTTLLRILTGLLEPGGGRVSLLGVDPLADPKTARRITGFVPSGDRSFYLRISGRENLVFFARLHGLRSRAAVARADEVLAEVDLVDAAGLRVGDYSHGMQKRLGVARALLARPPVLLLDEPTHDLDPEGAARVRSIVRALADDGAAVLWTTQRLEEISGFATSVTLLRSGTVCFAGSVSQLAAHAAHRQYLLHLDVDAAASAPNHALAGLATISQPVGADAGHYLMTLADGVVLDAALAGLMRAGTRILRCTEARSAIEEAFISLVRASPRR